MKIAIAVDRRIQGLLDIFKALSDRHSPPIDIQGALVAGQAKRDRLLDYRLRKDGIEAA